MDTVFQDILHAQEQEDSRLFRSDADRLNAFCGNTACSEPRRFWPLPTGASRTLRLRLGIRFRPRCISISESISA